LSFPRPASFPRVAQLFNTCPSSKPFIVEFRIDERHPYGTGIPGLFGETLNVATLTLEVDGERLDEQERFGSIRRFLCEGDHRACIRYLSAPPDEKVEQAVDFAVPRPSLFM
jgi:hypothetical protein